LGDGVKTFLLEKSCRGIGIRG